MGRSRKGEKMLQDSYSNYLLDLDKIFHNLQNDLLYNLMSANKELFHSNLHAWLFRKCPELKKRFFKEFGVAANTKKHDVIREEKNIDLILKEPNFANIIIENKIYSDLQTGQLEKYTKELDEDDEPWNGFVLSLIAPEFNRHNQSIQDKWRWIPYNNFINFIELNKSCLELSTFEHEYLDHYIQMINKLSEAIGALLPGPIDQVEMLRLDFDKTFLGNINRMRSRVICNYLADEVRNNRSSGKSFSSMYFNSGITRSQIFIECEIPLSDGNFLGWQLQGEQFRLYARVITLAGEGRHAERVDYALKNYGPWFKFDVMFFDEFDPLVIMPKNQRNMGQFNPDFVYQYAKVTGIKLITLHRISLALGRRPMLEELISREKH